MGRQLRKVASNWKHPKNENGYAANTGFALVGGQCE